MKLCDHQPVPACALGFEAVDVLQPASSGIYPAYPSEPFPPYTVWAQAGLMYDSNPLATQGGLLDRGGNIQVHKN